MARALLIDLPYGILDAFRQQNTLAAALREIGRVERTFFTLRWFEDPALRRQVTAERNKGEARNTLARAVAFHRLGRFRDRGHENQQTRTAALNLVTAAIILFNCRYLDHAGSKFNLGTGPGHADALRQLSPLGWDHINLTGDYVWSDPEAFGRVRQRGGNWCNRSGSVSGGSGGNSYGFRLGVGGPECQIALNRGSDSLSMQFGGGLTVFPRGDHHYVNGHFAFVAHSQWTFGRTLRECRWLACRDRVGSDERSQVPFMRARLAPAS